MFVALLRVFISCRYETAWSDWTPNLWNELGTPPPPMELLPPSYDVRLDTVVKVANSLDIWAIF